MADISKLNLNGTTLNIKDAEARELIEALNYDVADTDEVAEYLDIDITDLEEEEF